MTDALIMILISVAWGIRADLTGEPRHKRASSYWFWASLAVTCLVIADLRGWL